MSGMLLERCGVMAKPTAAPGATYLQEVDADSPDVHWRFGEASGTNADDRIGTKDATYSNVTLGVTGALASDADKAITLNGAVGLVTVPATVASYSGVAVSFEIWMKTADTSQADQLLYAGYQNGGGFAGWGVFYNLATSHKIGYYSSTNGSWMESTGTITNTSWHHVVVTVSSGGAVTFYIDGSAAGTASSSAPGLWAGSKCIGASADGSASFFKGSLDEPAIYPTVLSGARVAAHNTAGIT